jgi:hypothetical protein
LRVRCSPWAALLSSLQRPRIGDGLFGHATDVYHHRHAAEKPQHRHHGLDGGMPADIGRGLGDVFWQMAAIDFEEKPGMISTTAMMNGGKRTPRRTKHEGRTNSEARMLSEQTTRWSLCGEGIHQVGEEVPNFAGCHEVQEAGRHE